MQLDIYYFDNDGMFLHYFYSKTRPSFSDSARFFLIWGGDNFELN